MGIDSVPRRTGNIADNHALLAENLVDQRRLAHIRPSDDGNPYLVGVGVLARIVGKVCRHRVEKVAEIQRIRRGNGNRIAESQIVKFIDVSFLLRAVDFVDREHHGLFRRAKHPRNFLVRRGHSRAPVHDEHNHIGLIDGNPCLFPDRRQELLVLELDSARVHHRERASQPLRVRVNTVASHARHIVHNRNTPFPYLVEQRRFPDIRPSHDSHNQLAHFQFPPSFVYAALDCHI